MLEAAPKRAGSKGLLIGCVVAVMLLLLCGGGVAFFGARLFQAGVQQLAQDEEFAQAWQSPVADAPAEAFAPERVLDYERTSVDEEGAFPALGLDQDGPHAVYERGADRIEVSAYRMDETAKTAAFEEVIRRINDGDRFKMKSHVRLPRSLRFHIEPPELNGVLWHAGGWLVFVRSATVGELDGFLKAYLEGVSGGEAAAVDSAVEQE